MEPAEEAKLIKIRIAVIDELANVQRSLDLKKRVDEQESDYPELWNYKHALKRILKVVEAQIWDK